MYVKSPAVARGENVRPKGPREVNDCPEKSRVVVRPRWFFPQQRVLLFSSDKKSFCVFGLKKRVAVQKSNP